MKAKKTDWEKHVTDLIARCESLETQLTTAQADIQYANGQTHHFRNSYYSVREQLAVTKEKLNTAVRVNALFAEKDLRHVNIDFGLAPAITYDAQVATEKMGARR